VAEHPEALHPVTRRVLERAQRFSAADGFRAQHRLAALRRRVERLWSDVDALVVPTAVAIDTLEAVEAEPVRLNSQLGEYTQFVNLLDLCAVAVPAGFRANGLPFGITLAGPALADAPLAALAARFHHATSVSLGATGHPLPEPPAAPQVEEPLRIGLAVIGTHLSDQPLNHELRALGATLARACHTAPVYRLYALTTTPPKPGLIRVAEGGAAIEAEVWWLEPAAFGTFVGRIPAPLGIGTVELEDGTSVKGFLCEPYAAAGAPDISAFGGWRAYLADRRVASGTRGGGGERSLSGGGDA
jgi:allophanate hydrolase